MQKKQQKTKNLCQKFCDTCVDTLINFFCIVFNCYKFINMKFCGCCELKLSKTQIKNKKYTTKKQIKTKMIDNKIAKTLYLNTN